MLQAGVGAVVGGVLAGVVPSSVLKLGLRLILIVSAWRTFRHSADAITPELILFGELTVQ